MTCLTKPALAARRILNDDQVAAVIERALRTTPADATHWSIRSIAVETRLFPRDPLNVDGVRLTAAP